jgi:hypothetical protein
MMALPTGRPIRQIAPSNRVSKLAPLLVTQSVGNDRGLLTANPAFERAAAISPHKTQPVRPSVALPLRFVCWRGLWPISNHRRRRGYGTRWLSRCSSRFSALSRDIMTFHNCLLIHRTMSWSVPRTLPNSSANPQSCRTSGIGERDRAAIVCLRARTQAAGGVLRFLLGALLLTGVAASFALT